MMMLKTVGCSSTVDWMYYVRKMEKFRIPWGLVSANDSPPMSSRKSKINRDKVESIIHRFKSPFLITLP